MVSRFCCNPLFLFIFFLTLSVHAPGRTKNYTIENGLQDQYVECIAQDSAGFVWVGSKSGITRLETGRFIPGRIEDISSEKDSRPIIRRVYAILRDKSNRLWVGTDGDGLLRYDYDKNIFRSVLQNENDQYSIVKKIQEDTLENIWISTPYSIGKLTANGDIKWHKVIYENNECFINAIICDKDGSIWAGSRENGLYRFNAETDAFEPFHYFVNGELFDGSIISLAESQGKLLIGTERFSLHVLDLSSLKVKVYSRTENNSVLDTDEIFSIYVNRIGNVAIGAINGGAATLDLKDGVLRRLHFSLNDNVITPSSFFEDRKGNLWIGTHSRGVFISGQDNPTMQMYWLTDPQTKLSSEKPVTALLKDRKGNIWAGTDGNGIYVRRDGSTIFETLPKSSGMKSSVILDIDEMPDGTIWMSTWGDGIAIYDPSKQIVHYENSRLPNSINYDNIKSMFFDGKYCWIATHGGGIKLYDWQKQKFVGGSEIGITDEGLKLPLWGNIVNKDLHGRIWIGTTIGLFMFDGKEMHTYLTSSDNNESISSNYISDIYCDKSGTVWIGTLGGLCRYDASRDVFTRVIHQEINSPIYSISGIDSSSLIISTPSAIYKYDKQTDIAEIYTSFDFLYIDNFAERSAITVQDSVLYFGCTGSILSFIPAQLTKNNHVSIRPTALYLNNNFIDPNLPNPFLQKQLYLIDTLQIDYTKTLLRIDYFDLDPTDEPYINYRYKLIGFDKSWNNAGKQTAALYSNLPYGNYSFVVQAIDLQGTVVGESKKIIVMMLPPWWAMLWFKVLMSVSAIFIVLGLFILRIQVIARRKKAIEDEVARRTSDLLAAYEELSSDQQALLDQNDELQESQEMTVMRMQALRESLRTKDELIAIIAHDLKNPIGAASGMLSLLGGFFEMGNKDKFTKFQSHIQNSMSSMQNLVDSMTDWSLCEAGQLKYSPTEVHIDHIVREVLSLVSASAEKKNISIVYKYDLQKYALADSRMLATIFRNLIQNAIKFTPAQGSITIKVREEDDKAICSVTDSGIGMSPALQDMLISGGSIVPHSGTDNEKGIGLGLQTCRKFINFCKGEFRIESTLGAGSEFSFTLPVVEKIAEIEEPEQQSEDLATEVTANVTERAESDYIPRLIVVDDNPQMLALLSESFKDGYEVFVFENPESALECAREMIPDLIVSDVMMPQMNGTDFCQKIKSDHLTQHIPLIFPTSQTSPLAEIKGLNAGADDYMTKPFDLNRLKAKIQSLLHNRQLLRDSIDNGETTVAEEPIDPFMHDFHNIVTSNIDNYNLSIEFVADIMHYSKSQIYRKCIALTGIAPAEYIREHKLQEAKKLLNSTEKAISDIAFDLGFSDPQYFSKVFVKKFGISPKKYRDQNQ